MIQLFQLERKGFMSKDKCLLSSMNPFKWLHVTKRLELKDIFSFIRSRSSSISVFTNPVIESAAISSA